MSVVGIDLGNQNAVIAQAVRGGVDIILNESSKRLTPAIVSFVGNERYLGEQAATQVRTNMANTVTQVKQIIGRKFSEPGIAYEMENHLNYRLRKLDNDDIGIDVRYNDSMHTFTPTQVLGMLLTNLKEIISVKNPATTAIDVVLSVPAHFTDAQRCALRDAAAIAGLNCLRVLNEGTAAALSYGIYKSAKKEFPEGGESKVLFLDMGNAHFTATVAGFTNGSLRIIASESDPDVGGRELDNAIAKYFAAEFRSKTGIDAWSDRKARLKLQVAAEKAKTTITPFGVNSASVGVECLKDDRDFSGALTLEKFEELAAPYMARMQAAIKRACDKAGVSNPAKEFYAIELVGGSMRPRVVKRAAAVVLGLPLNEETGHSLGTSMNLDEAVSRGCSLACAMLSPIFRVKPFDVIDSVPYPIQLSWDPASAGGSTAGGSGAAMDVDEEAATGGGGAAGGAGSGGDASAGSSSSTSVGTGSESFVTIFPAGSPSPHTNRVTFRRSATFEITAEYAGSPTGIATLVGPTQATGGVDAPALPYAGHPRTLARYSIVVPADAAEPGAPAPRIRLDFKHDISGTFSIVKAELLKEIKEATPTAAPAPAEGAAADAQAGSTAGAPMDASADAPAPAPEPSPSSSSTAPAKKRYKRVELPVNVVTANTGGLTDAALTAAINAEAEMVARDESIRATYDMRNTLEAYIYATRDAIYGDLADFSTDAEKEGLQVALDAAQIWLEDNFEAEKAAFEGKLRELKALGDRLTMRRSEFEGRANAGDALLADIEHYRGIQNNRDGKHGHLSDGDRDILRAVTADAESWFRNSQELQASLPLNVDPVIRIAEIQQRRDGLHKELRPIANKPVPKAAPAPAPAPAQAPAPAPTPATEGGGGADNGAGADAGASAQPPPAPADNDAAQPGKGPQMDVD